MHSFGVRVVMLFNTLKSSSMMGFTRRTAPSTRIIERVSALSPCSPWNLTA